MTVIAKPTRRRSRRAGTVVELYVALDALLPFAETEVECASDYCTTCPDHSTMADVEYADRGRQAVELAKRLLDQKTAYIRRRALTLREPLERAGSSGEAPAIPPEETR